MYKIGTGKKYVQEFDTEEQAVKEHSVMLPAWKSKLTNTKTGKVRILKGMF